MRLLDWAVVAAYLIYIIWDGVRMTKHSGNAEGYFLANRSLPWWAVGLSVMATQLSAITLVGTTGQGYNDGMRFIQFYYGLPLAMVILCITAVPSSTARRSSPLTSISKNASTPRRARSRVSSFSSRGA